MERLTTDRDYLVDKAEYERHLAQGYPRSTPRERFLKLCEYERTGHTPEEIAEFDRMYYAKCEEVNQLRAELAELRSRLPQFEIGDVVYIVDFEAGVIDASEINGIVHRADASGVEYEYDSDLLEFHSDDIGVIVFGSHGEAEEALKRRSTGICRAI